MKLFLIFHINLCFSSIEENEREKIIKNCYWPLLKLIEELNLPIGIEASGYSLEEIKKIDPLFIDKLNYLIKRNLCEFIDSGYCQIIGPLVPSKLNEKNLEIGKKVYKKILGSNSKIAFINEQTFSTGIIENYIKKKYKAVIMDWDNSAQSNKDIKKEYFFYPQQILASNKKKINVIWSSSVFFQKFQRYVQGEIELSEYLSFLKLKKNNDKNSSVCIYASDLEAINYRPKRYKNESIVINDEWNRVRKLLSNLKEKSFLFIKPSDILNLKKNSKSFKKISFSNPAFPCITKKQKKYNLLRWAVTGRNDNKINTLCWKIFNFLNVKKIKNISHWKRLCYFWSSDFRTHITKKRWDKYNRQLIQYFKKTHLRPEKIKYPKNLSKKVSYHLNKNKIFIKNKNLELILNINRGCSIEKFYDYRISKNYLFGFVPHGYFDDIGKSADFYSGHQLVEPLGKHKITDLKNKKIKIKKWQNGLIVESIFKDKIGIFKKEILFDHLNNRIGIKNYLKLSKNLDGSIRLSHVTLNPEIFKNKLFYATHNGGNKIEKFILNKNKFDHGKSVSHLISANQALGLTENNIYLGDKSKKVCISIDRNFDTQVGMISFEKIAKKNFFRLYFSVKEHDDTTKHTKNFKIETLNWIKTVKKINEKIQ